jgi:hypothetical protein
MDHEYQAQLEEQLRVERRLLHHDIMKRAQYGISTDPSVLMRIEDREKEIARLEARLGIAQPVYQARPEPRRAYRPEPDLRQQHSVDVQHHVKLLGIHRANLGHLKEQLRQLGAYAPPYVRTSIQEAQQGIAKEKRTLREAGVAVEDFEGE